MNEAIKRGDDKKNPPDPTGWFWTLNDLRNQGMHRNLIKKHVDQCIREDVNSGASRSGSRFYLITKPQTNLETIPYLKTVIRRQRIWSKVS